MPKRPSKAVAAKRPVRHRLAAERRAVDSDDAFLRSFGERIRAERSRRGMSRKLLADHAGISERYITQLESGKGNISIVLLRHVAAALGLPLSRLVEDGNPSAEMTLIREILAPLSPSSLTE